MASSIAVYLSPPPADYCLLLISHICLGFLKEQIPAISYSSLVGFKLCHEVDILLFICATRHMDEVHSGEFDVKMVVVSGKQTFALSHHIFFLITGPDPHV